ncbi:MAG TPA: hypothetical protein VD948_01590 [Rhodothermales bacterium]|nr:hypothetical protein [Rhodothermales bacterium]
MRIRLGYDRTGRPLAMAKMEIDAELHVPGLDLVTQRWNYHTLFMQAVHAHFDNIAAAAWAEYQEKGGAPL